MEKVAHTKDTVSCCADFCRKISPVLLILFPPQARTPWPCTEETLLFHGEEEEDGEDENISPAWAGLWKTLGLLVWKVDMCFSAGTLWTSGIFLSKWVLRNFKACTIAQQPLGMHDGRVAGMTSVGAVWLSWLSSKWLQCQQRWSCRVQTSAFLKLVKLKHHSYLCSDCTEAGSWGRCGPAQPSLP